MGGPLLGLRYKLTLFEGCYRLHICAYVHGCSDPAAVPPQEQLVSDLNVEDVHGQVEGYPFRG